MLKNGPLKSQFPWGSKFVAAALCVHTSRFRVLLYHNIKRYYEAKMINDMCDENT